MYVNYYYNKYTTRSFRIVCLQYNPSNHQFELGVKPALTESIWMVPGTVED